MKKIIVALGNYDPIYFFTRHNTGFIFLDYLETNFKFKFDKNKQLNCFVGKIKFKQNEIIFVKPNCYMNNSGFFVKKALDFYNLEVSNTNFLLIHDELDLKFGNFKYQKKRKHVSHNGVLDVISHIQKKDFLALRIGISPKEKNKGGKNFVLSKFKKDELQKLKQSVFPQAAESIHFWIEEENTEKLFALYNCEEKPPFERFSSSKRNLRSEKNS